MDAGSEGQDGRERCAGCLEFEVARILLFTEAEK